jgi:hypothetical protein
MKAKPLHHVDPSFRALTGGETKLRCHMALLHIHFSENSTMVDTYMDCLEKIIRGKIAATFTR